MTTPGTAHAGVELSVWQEGIDDGIGWRIRSDGWSGVITHLNWTLFMEGDGLLLSIRDVNPQFLKAMLKRLPELIEEMEDADREFAKLHSPPNRASPPSA